MGLFNSMRNAWPSVNMSFAPPPSVVQMDPSAFITPQEKAAADKARRGDLMNQTMNSIAGQGNIQGQPPAAGGVPGEGGGAAPPPADSANIQSIMSTLGMGGGPAAAGGGGGMMASIMKFLPMLMGG